MPAHWMTPCLHWAAGGQMCAILSPPGCCGRAKGCPTTAATAPPPGADRDAEPLRVLGHNHKTGSWLVGAMLYCATNAKVMRI